MRQTASRFFPPSVCTFQAAMDMLKENDIEQEKLIADVSAQLGSFSQAQIQLGDSIEKCQTQLSALIRENQAQYWALLQEYQTEKQSDFAAREKFNSKLMGDMEGLSRILTELQSACGGIQATLSSVATGIYALYQKDFPIDVRLERGYYKNFPVCTSPEAPDFQADFLALVNGLDKESVETVVLALQRLKLILNSSEITMPLYSAEEKRIFSQLFEHFLSNILKLSESCYFYDGYMLPINYFEANVFWDKCGVPLLKHPERLTDKDIIDAGAFIGDSALIFSPLTKRKVYAFEPAPANYDLLLKTIEMNSMTNVVPCQSALGEKRGTGVFSVGANGSASSLYPHDGVNYYGKFEANIIPLDEYVKNNNLNVGLIKMDVEGSEQLLLQGAMETIKSQKPTLLISIYHNASDFFHIKPMLDELHLGYKFKIRHPVGGTVMTEMLLIAEIQD